MAHRFRLRAIILGIACVISIATALTNVDLTSSPDDRDTKFRALRNLHDDEVGLEEPTQDADNSSQVIPPHHDIGPGWPVPGPESFKITEKMLKNAAKDAGNRADFPRIIQPISFINFVMKDGTGKVSYSAIQAQVAQLNRAYSGDEARAAGYAKATDTNIRFVLAGVRFVVNDDYFNLCTLPTTINVVRPKYMMSGATHLNIYICWCQNNLGLAWLPYDSWFRQNTDENHYALGATVHWNLLPGNTMNKGLWSKGNIMTHEIGHCYGLRHPYEGDCLGGESNSDQIDDTPRMTGNPLATCQAVKNRDSCPTLAGKDDMQNYMVATADSCRNHFTPGQVEYMQTVIRTYKPTLMKQLLPSCVAAIDSTDASPDLQPCLAGTLKTAVGGRQYCLTDPDDKTVWGWACCPTSLDWTSQDCWQGTPDFSRPTEPVNLPRGGSGTPAPTDAPIAKTQAPTKKTKAPTPRTTGYPTAHPTLSPSEPPTPRPTKKPTTRRQGRRAKLRARAKARQKKKSG
jgi:hypothetical protein